MRPRHWWSLEVPTHRNGCMRLSALEPKEVGALHCWQKMRAHQCLSSFVSPELKRDYTECDVWRRSALAKIADLRPAVVVLANSSVGYFEHLGPHSLSLAEWRTGVEEMLEVLKAQTAVVAVQLDNPQFRHFDPRQCVGRALLIGTVDIARCAQARDVALSPQVKEAERTAVQAVPGASVIDLSDYYCAANTCSTYVDGIIVMRDTNHISVAMTQHLSEPLSQALAELMSRATAK